MALSLTQAAKAAKISKSTLSVAIQKGRVSARHLPGGSYEIEPVELFRVFPPKADRTGEGEGVRPATEPTPNRAERLEPNPGLLPSTPVTTTELEVLRVKLSSAERELERERETVDDLRRRLDREQEERRTLQLRLMPPEKPVEDSSELEALRKRLEEVEGQMVAAVTALERVQERAVEVEPSKSPKGFLSRLMGR